MSQTDSASPINTIIIKIILHTYLKVEQHNKKDMKVTVIGAGNMGGALIKGWAKNTEIELTITAKTDDTLNRFAQEYPQLHTCKDNAEAVKGADVIVLAVKPWLIEQVCNQIKDSIDFDNQIIISIAANIFADKLREYLNCDTAKVIYVMPNIAAEFSESMTFLAPGDDIPSDVVGKIEALLQEVGKVKRCTEEGVAGGNMLAGCGIAYIMRFIHAMMEGGVEMGLYPRDAQMIAMQAMKGAVSVLEGTGMHPAVAIDKVTTPGGLTIRGLNELDHAGFNSAVIRCLKAGLVK